MEGEKRKPSGWLNVAVDYGPLIVFLAVYKLSEPSGDDMTGTIAAIVRGTGAFIVAAVAALVFSRVKFGRVSPMLWLSTVLILGFGTLTVLLGDVINPTASYAAKGNGYHQLAANAWPAFFLEFAHTCRAPSWAIPYSM